MEALSSHLIHQRLARLEVGLKGKAGGFDRNGLRGDHQLTTTFTLTKPVTKRANPVLIANAIEAKARDHRHRCVGAAAATMNPFNGMENMLGRQLVDVELTQLVRQDVEQHLGVRARSGACGPRRRVRF